MASSFNEWQNWILRRLCVEICVARGSLENVIRNAGVVLECYGCGVPQPFGYGGNRKLLEKIGFTTCPQGVE